MNVLSFSKTESPDGLNMIRLSAEVAYDNPDYSNETIWFDFPAEFSTELSESSNPWLSCLLPIAVKLKEPLRIPGAVDRVHYDQALEIMKIWHSWYPQELAIIPVEVNTVDDLNVGNPTKSLGFYSAGIDSSYSLYHHNNPQGEGKDRIDEMVLLLGFDIPLTNRQQYDNKLIKSRIVADYFHTRIFGIVTNIRESKMAFTGWGYHSHGAVLAAVGLFLEKRYNRVFIASTGGYQFMDPWGSHVLTDHLNSTKATQIFHDTPDTYRFDKSYAIADVPVLMDALHVCNKSFDDTNCCACEKCLRTLIVYDLINKLDKCTSFDLKKYQIRNISKIWISYHLMEYDWEYIKSLARQHSRKNIVSFINNSFRMSRRLSKMVKYLTKFKKTKFVWRIAIPLRDWLLKQPIR